MAASLAEQRIFGLQADPFPLAWAYRLTGALDVAALERAVQALVERHAVLRSVFHQSAARLVKSVRDSAATPFEYLDLSLRGPDDARSGSLERVHAFAARGFDQEHGPLVRAQVTRISSTEHVFAFSLSHAVADWGSIGIFESELSVLYSGEALPPLAQQYESVSQRQRDDLDSGRFAKDLEWWQTHLLGLEPLDFGSVTRGDGPFQRVAAQDTAFVNSAAVAKYLKTTHPALGCVAAQAAFAGAFHHLTGREDLGFYAPYDLRRAARAEGVIGYLIGGMVLRLRVNSAMLVSELVAQARAELRAATQRGLAPVIPVLYPHAPAFYSVNFNYLVARPPLRLTGLDVTPVALASWRALGTPYDVLFMFDPPNGGLVIHDAAKFSTRVGSLLSAFSCLLEKVASGEAISVGAALEGR